MLPVMLQHGGERSCSSLKAWGVRSQAWAPAWLARHRGVRRRRLRRLVCWQLPCNHRFFASLSHRYPVLLSDPKTPAGRLRISSSAHRLEEAEAWTTPLRRMIGGSMPSPLEHKFAFAPRLSQVCGLELHVIASTTQRH